MTAHSLIKTAIEHGTAVGSEVARRVEQHGRNGVLALCVVGAGPAGLACCKKLTRALTEPLSTAAGGRLAELNNSRK